MRKNYKDMTNKEIWEQIQWSDSQEFSYGYSKWAFNEIDSLNRIINKVERRAKKKIKNYKEYISWLSNSNIENKRNEIFDLKYRIIEQEDLLRIIGDGE